MTDKNRVERSWEDWHAWLLYPMTFGAAVGFFVCLGFVLALWHLKEGQQYEAIKRVFHTLAYPAGWFWDVCVNLGLVSVHGFIGAFALIFFWYTILGAIAATCTAVIVRLLLRFGSGGYSWHSAQ